MVDGGGCKRYCFVLSSRQSVGVGFLIPRDFIPYPETSSRVTVASLYGVFQTLLSNSGGSFQHRDAEASEILFSGFSVPLVVIHLDIIPGLHAPLMASSRRSCRRR